MSRRSGSQNSGCKAVRGNGVKPSWYCIKIYIIADSNPSLHYSSDLPLYRRKYRCIIYFHRLLSSPDQRIWRSTPFASFRFILSRGELSLPACFVAFNTASRGPARPSTEKFKEPEMILDSQCNANFARKGGSGGSGGATGRKVR